MTSSGFWVSGLLWILAEVVRNRITSVFSSVNLMVPINSGSICHSQLIVIDDAIITRTSLKSSMEGVEDFSRHI